MNAPSLSPSHEKPTAVRPGLPMLVVTLGLPFVRTSPDHGTALDLAGSGKASPRSLMAALRVAGEMARRRAS